MKTKVQIKSIFGRLLFEFEKENNTVRDTVLEAIKRSADLRNANLRNANLYNAYLSNADLSNAYLYGADLRNADLRNANLSSANLSNANLRNADLYNANLYNANLSNADLRNANLSNANLYNANLRNAYLYGADLRNANLSNANLYNANLYNANLSSADLRNADLRNAKNIPFVPIACPSDGAFIGWKKVGEYLVKLEIPEDAKRCSATTNKCRCDRAKVLSIVSLEDNHEENIIENTNYAVCMYRVGEMVYPDKFDDDRWNECSSGIHFFINKQEAINYK